MKIESNPKMIDAINPLSKKTEAKRPEKTFGQIMAETVKSNQVSTQDVSSLKSISAMSPLPLMPLKNELDRADVVLKVEELITLLDQYRAQLENQNISLKDISPVTQTMAAKLEELEPALAYFDNEDPLKSILHETFFTASLEMKKFENGWYNPL